MSLFFMRSFIIFVSVTLAAPVGAQSLLLGSSRDNISPEDRLRRLERKLENRCEWIDETQKKLVGYENTLSLVNVNYSIARDQYYSAVERTGNRFSDEITELDLRGRRWLERWGKANSDVTVAKGLIETWSEEKKDIKDRIDVLKENIGDPAPPPAPGGGRQAGADKGGKRIKDAEKDLDDLGEKVDRTTDKITRTGKKVTDVVEDGEELVRLWRLSIARLSQLPPAGVPTPGPDNGSGQPDFAALFGKFSLDGDIGYQRERLPDFRFGVTSLGTNLAPLHDIVPKLDGIRVDLGINLESPGPVADTWWTGRIGGGVSKTKGTRKQTIGGFAPGQVPSYIDLSGTGGFAFNNNSIVQMDVAATRFDINGEFGIKKVFPNGIIANPHAGAFFRHSQVDYDLTIDTDFLNGRFFNTLNERLRLNQLGLDVGLDLTWQPHNRVSFTVGGHAGLAYTDASYSGRDCGDGSLLTPGCDGALFANGGVSRGRESVDPFAGLKAAIGIYLFCRKNAVPIAAHALNAAAQALKSSCVSVGAQGTFDVMPSVSIDHSTALGGPSVGLSGDNSKFYSATGRVTLPF